MIRVTVDVRWPQDLNTEADMLLEVKYYQADSLYLFRAS
jgi:hypothetical protein